MIKINKIISRDIPLSNIFAWHKGYTSGLQKWLGWSYSDALFYVHDGYADIMRPPVEHLEIFRDYVLKKINTDPIWFKNEYDSFLNFIKEIELFYRSIDPAALQTDATYAVKTYEKYTNYIIRVMGPYITMLWLPIWLENDAVAGKKYLKEIAFAMDARKKSEMIFPRGDEIIMQILYRVASELNFDIALIKMVSHDELAAYFKKGEKFDEFELNRRISGFIYGKKGIIIVENKIKKIKEVFASLGYEYDIKDNSGVAEINGSVACPGKIQGVVRVITSKNKISEVVNGDILVASMTTPEYLPAMKKAGAFVTDEGGITCHAAIVARELKKPCIIGTKIATQVLKDGDLVEVDADKGVVKIIK